MWDASPPSSPVHFSSSLVLSSPPPPTADFDDRVPVDLPAAPVARETVAPVAREPVAPIARESVARAARLATEPVTPVDRVLVAPFASVPVAPVVRVPAASAATHHLLYSHGPSSSSLALSFLRCAGCTPSGGVVHMAIPACS
ncbi:unnamed protein product [Closterium sp. NIES-53]